MPNGLHQFTNVGALATTVVRSGKGKLHAITMNQAIASGVLTIYDNTSAAGSAIIGTITHPGTLLQNQYCLIYDVCFQTGLTIVSDHNDNFTVSWEPL